MRSLRNMSPFSQFRVRVCSKQARRRKCTLQNQLAVAVSLAIWTLFKQVSDRFEVTHTVQTIQHARQRDHLPYTPQHARNTTCFNPEMKLCPGSKTKACRGDINMIWSLGFGRGRDPFNMTFTGPIQTGQDASIRGPSILFLADPFLYIDGQIWIIFTEALNNDCQKGEIAYHQSLDHGSTWTYGSIVLAESWHLSFPSIVTHAGKIYMMTCATAGTTDPYSIWLYSATDFPRKWVREMQIIMNQTIGRPVDPILLLHDNTWYLFVLDDGINKERLFFSSSLFGPFTEHPKSRQYFIRQSGNIIKDDEGELWAFHHTSDTVERWRLNVLTRSDYGYAQKLSLLSPMNASWARGGMHTFSARKISARDWVVAVDGYWSDREFKTFHCLESGNLACQGTGVRPN